MTATSVPCESDYSRLKVAANFIARDERGNIVTSLDSNSEMTRLMALAFDHAWDRFVVPGVPVEADKLRPILAQHIVEMVRHGERDLDRISKGGLVRLREVALGTREPSPSSNRQQRRELRS